jgi:hypothetical protein
MFSSTLHLRLRLPHSQVPTPRPPKITCLLSFRLSELKGLDLFEITIEELQRNYQHGSFTSVDYIQFCLDRIQKIDPYLEAIIETNLDALSIAASLNQERKDGNVRGPLHGVRLLLKMYAIRCFLFPSQGIL